MTLYGIIYDWFSTHVFTSQDVLTLALPIGDTSVSLADWLNHTATIIVLILLVVVAFRAIWWLVRLVVDGFSRVVG